MIVTFAYPTTPLYSGGVVTLWEYANGLARRGHEVHIVHGPTIPGLITSIDQIDWFTFDPTVAHHIVGSIDDPSLPSADVIFQMGAPARLGQPVVLVQGYRLLATALERPAFRAPCPKICVARWLTDVGEAWGSHPEQLLHVPPGIDHHRFAPPPGPDHRPIDVAMLSSIHPVKGGDDGLAALHRVHRHRPELRVALFGIIAPDHEVPPWAAYHRAPHQDELARNIYGRARIFLQPSRREGFGLTAVEAMATGCALVTTDNGGSRDYADDDQSAVVVPPRRPGALAAAIIGLLEDEDRLRRLAEAGRRVASRFTWDRAAADLEAHLERYLADPAALQKPPLDAPMFLEDSW